MMRLLNGVVKTSRRLIRFALATLLWAHTVFLLQIPFHEVDRLARTIHLSVAELLLFGLLIAFSYLAGTSFWSAVGNLVYIYCFPFVILFYLAKWFLKGFLALGRWINRDQITVSTEVRESEESAPSVSIALASSTTPAQPVEAQGSARAWSFVLRPLRRFTLLWCILLLCTSHSAIRGFALAIVIMHLVRFVLSLTRISLALQTVATPLERAIRENVDQWLAKLALVTEDTPPDQDMKVLLQTLRFFETGIRAIKNEALVARWAALISGAILTALYVYIAFLFSFIYYGVERLSGYSDTWAQLFVTSIFIPFLVGTLPKAVALDFLAGIQCTLILSIGVGTIVRFLRSQLRPIKAVAAVVDLRLADDAVRSKYNVLKSKFAAPGAEAKT